MQVKRFVIPYDIVRHCINGHQRSIFHDFADWGNELVIVCSGSAIFRLDDQQFPIAQGDVFLLTGDYTKEVIKANKLNMCSIFYHDAHMQRSAASFRHMEGFQKLFVENPLAKLYGDHHHLKADDYLIDDLETLIARMELETRLRDVGYEQVLNSTFFILVTLIARAYSSNELFVANAQGGITQVMAYMRCHYDEDLTLEKLAAMAHTSPRHFDRCFKDAYHTSPLQFIRNLRLERACILLEQTHLSITEISMQCGFADVNYFSKSFKSVYEVTPSRYRTAYLEGSATMPRFPEQV